MSEELLQRGLDKKNPSAKVGKWDYYNIGSTTLKALKAANIIRNIDYGHLENKKVDALIVNKKEVIAIVEFKQPKEFKTDAQKQKAINQEIEVAIKLGAKIIIATDTKDTVWINALTGKNIIDEDNNMVSFPFDITNEKLPALIEKINYSINEKNNHILPKELVNPTDLARSIWQDIWSVSGATPENCLYTFVELFIFKYLSDLGILKNTNSFDFVMAMYKNDTDDDVLQYYAGNIRKKIKELFPYNPKDNTTIINGTIFVSKDQKAVSGYSTVFKKVLEKFNHYGRLEHIDYDFKSKLFESFLKESISKKNWGQFFTPIKVIRAIEQMAKDEIKEGVVICDPACGVGKFLLEPIKNKLNRFYSIEGDKVIPKITLRGFDKGFDKDEQKTIILAKANMLIYFSEIIKDYPNHTKEFAKIFNESFTLKTNSILGTLREPVENEYDLILTNPPYVTSGSSNLKDEIQKDTDLKNYYKINAIGVEGLFMEWIVRALKPNGKAFVVVPDGIFNRQNDKNLRAFLRQECFIDGIISLPLNTFFTTNKKTYILCLTKKNNKADIQTDPVFTYFVSEIGESRDVYRFEIEQNDLNEATTLYSFFKGNKSSFNTINKDPRCKIVPIEQFDPNTYWSIDKWWSKEEKIALGVEEEGKVIDVLEFSSLVSDMADTFGEFSAILKEVGQKKTPNYAAKEITLNNENFFEFISTKTGWTKTQYRQFDTRNSNDIPLYTAAKYPVAFVKKDHNGIIDANIESPVISFAANGDGSAGTNLMLHIMPFYVSNDRTCLKIVNQYINVEYIFTMLHGMKEKYDFNHAFKASKNNMKIVSLNIPVLSNGEFDTEAQKEIIEKYNVVADLKAKAREYEQILKELVITVEDDNITESKEVLINDIFELPSIKGVTKEFIEKNKGNIPVYGGKQLEEPIGYVADSLEGIKYFENCLAWNREGSVGYVFWHKHKFTTNDHHRPLKLKSEFLFKLDLEYLRYEIQDNLLKQGFRWSQTASKEKVGKISISIPLLPNGEFDFETQQAIAEKYNKIKEIKSLLSAELKKINDFSLIV
jgi:type I restriction-modification system DNA methylase subunit